MGLRKWRLVSKVDVSPSEWFPVEQRSYLLPDERLVDDFFVTTLADSVNVIAITRDKKVVLIRMYKPGIDEIMIQFPAGRFEGKHKSIVDAEVQELEEETGIKVSKEEMVFVGKLALMTTKATEAAHYYLVTDVSFNSQQNLDEDEEIEVLTLDPKEVDLYIKEGKIWDAPCIAGWELAKKKFGKLFV